MAAHHRRRVTEPDTLGALLDEAARTLGDRAEAALLLAHLSGRSRTALLAFAEASANPALVSALRELVARRVRGEPIAYLTGQRGFWRLALAVSPAVLIPRPETELVVELALARIDPLSAPTLLDLGTGSGAIALALALERPRAQVYASDASAPALALAQANAALLKLDRVQWARGDWWTPWQGQRFDLVASNPPYIAAGDPHLTQGDLRFEPSAALIGGADGLAALRTIIAAAPVHLNRSGWLLLEHGHDQGAAVRDLLSAAGLVEVSTERDLAGHERVSLGRAG